ncbi:hypothetical protein GGF46_002186 [Coemansia sp. RSA 552]|nr:hypothetical protein GGF46_002186 [Coemansia sp. RSA 552]
MKLTFTFAVLALTALTANSAVIPKRQADLDIDSLLDQIEEQYKNPEVVKQFASQAMEFVSANMPAGQKFSEEDVIAALESNDPEVISSMVSNALDTVVRLADSFNLGEDGEQVMSALKDSSVSSRLHSMITNLLDRVSEQYQEGDLGKPTNISADDDEDDSKEEDSTDDKEEDSADSKEEDSEDSADSKEEDSADDKEEDSADSKEEDSADDKKDDGKDDDKTDTDTEDEDGAASKVTTFLLPVGAALGAMAALF